MTDQKAGKAFCCPERAMLAKGLCSSCYQRGQREGFDQYRHIIDIWKAFKVDRSEKSLEKRRHKIKETRRGPSWRYVTLKQRYKLDEESYKILLVSQNNSCKICKVQSENLYVDHCHTTGKVRGLLCPKCNTFVGYVETSPEDRIKQIMDYLNDRPT